MRIRDAEIKDAAAIAALLGELGYPGTEDFAPTRSRASSRIRTRACWSRKPDGGVLGFIGLHFIVQLALPGDFCRITYFCVGGRRAAWAWAASLKRRPRGWRARAAATASSALPRAPRRRAPLLLPPGV